MILVRMKNIQPVYQPNGQPKVSTAPMRVKIGPFTRSRINPYSSLNKTNTASVVPDTPFPEEIHESWPFGITGCECIPVFGYFLPTIV